MSYEISFAVVGFEKAADGAIPIVRPEVASLAVIFCVTATGSPREQDVAAFESIAERLRQVKVLLRRDAPKLRAMFFKVLRQLLG